VITISWKLPDPWWVVTLLAFVPLLPVQSYINQLNLTVNPGCQVNSRFTVGNWVTIVVGTILGILAIIGSFIPNNAGG
jgi:hypothetical protein